MMYRRFVLTLILCAAVAPARPEDRTVDFTTGVRPIFEAHCVECHGPKKQEGGLRLDRRSAAIQGGDSYAPAIRPGASSESPLFQFIHRDDADLRMPPEGPRLSTAEVEIIRRWIDQGATGPEDGLTSDDRWSNHWSFQPLKRPSIPDGDATARNTIDHFIVARLKSAGLTLSPPASKATLIRRLYFDLLGLPPSPEEILEFEQDLAPDSYERLVDRLLASPAYGERWARHWLDAVRFAESHGFEMNQARPNAWPYRDYVIQSLNEDIRYDHFVREQIAGDALGQPNATSFLVGGPWDQVKSPDPVLTAQQRADELHDMISTTGSTFLALTVGCARCHSHKFDPISQTEYYAFKACFEGVMHGDRPIADPSTSAASGQVKAERLRAELASLESEPSPAAVNSRVNVERFSPVVAKKIRFTIRATNSFEPCIDELEVWTDSPARNVALATAGAVATASSTLPGSEIHRLEHIHDGQYGNSRSWISNEKGKGWVQIEFAKPERIDRVLWGRDREQKFTDRLATDYSIEVSEGEQWREVASAKSHEEPAERVAKRKELERQIAELLTGPMVYAGKFEQPGPTLRFHRGDATQPREPVAPASLSHFADRFELSEDAPEQQRRIALAEWLTDVDHPLTARVIVNRIWQYHFGEGIVATPSDFGINGAMPSHPELLDWLACELMDQPLSRAGSAWTMKRIHRLICCSATYRQSSQIRPEAQAIDASNRLLWRFTPRRLEAEPLRDTMLAVSGVLDRRMGGPGFDLFEPNTNYVKVYTPKQHFGPAEFRRMIYQAKPRMQLDDTFGAFDCPDAGQIAPKRNRSITPLQALNLLNSAFTQQQAEYFAERLERECGGDSRSQVVRAFQLAYGREPSDRELSAALQLVVTHGLPSLTRALFNTHEFLCLP